MRSRFSFAHTVRFSSKLLLTVATAALLTACSDSLERFASYGSNNPSDSDPVYTASVPKTKKLAAVSRAEDEIASSPLATSPIGNSRPVYDYSAPKLKLAKARPKLQLEQQAVSAPVEDEVNTSADVAMAEPAEQVPVLNKRKTALRSGTIRVERGMTLYSIARANNLSVRSLVKANNLHAPYNLAAGTTLRVPGRKAAIAPEVSEPRLADATPVKRKGGNYTVASGDTLYSIGRQHGVSPFIIADANGLKKNSTLSVGQSLRIPGGKAMTIAKAEDRILDTTKSPVESATIADTNDDVQTKPAIVAQVEIKPLAPLATKQVVQELPVASAGDLSMRWPATGKVISEFGSKPGGTKNEGINIAMPEGTPVRAAESGVVAYAGNELKGYGNLILIRHEGGYVTAYAHAKAMNVKRGDTVKRGDVIAAAGQTGAVSTPQLHFEVRKGATAMDPLRFLGKTAASN
jgi:murein DD-endopeptidase MepM/ murein hydrolase activator NlpD